MAQTPDDNAPDAAAKVVIKKYANRRLYNTESSSYITLDHLSTMTKENREFVVVDAKTGEDITRSVLTQIIMDEEGRGQNMLPVSFLRQIISMYGDSMQAMVPDYLEASMQSFRSNQEKFREAMKGAFEGGPFAELARRNMAIFEAATGIKTGLNKDKVAAEDSSKQAEIDALKAQLAALQDQVNKLDK